MHFPTRPVDKEKAENELAQNIKKATSPEETAPKQKHVRSRNSCITGLQLLTGVYNRMHCLHLGLPLFNVHLDGTESATNLS